MGRTWFVVGEAAYDKISGGIARGTICADRPARVLLLSRGDGVAVEVTVDLIRRALVMLYNDQPMSLLDAQVFLDTLTEQMEKADG